MSNPSVCPRAAAPAASPVEPHGSCGHAVVAGLLNGTRVHVPAAARRALHKPCAPHVPAPGLCHSLTSCTYLPSALSLPQASCSPCCGGCWAWPTLRCGWRCGASRTEGNGGGEVGVEVRGRAKARLVIQREIPGLSGPFHTQAGGGGRA